MMDKVPSREYAELLKHKKRFQPYCKRGDNVYKFKRMAVILVQPEGLMGLIFKL